MTTALNRAAQQIRAAQHASDQLSAFIDKRADAGHFVRKIASDLASALALAEASLMAASPRLHDQVIIGAPARVDSNVWLELGDGVTR